MKASEIRRRYLTWFEQRGHLVVPSAPLVPQNDPTLYFVNAGMVQFKDIFTGQETRPAPRATSVQKCLRVSGKHNDLENVGRTPRHHTFFEMLGNFSFGDYFKAEAIPFAWELLTGEFGLDPERLWVTIYNDDDEAHDIWRSIDFPAERIQRLGAKDNFWSMGDTGPCGPCTEIHYDHGAHLDPKGGGPATESDRYVEIWNLVFMQYDQAADGTRTLLPSPSIDTGMGLERLAAIKQGVYSNYDTDLFTGLLDTTARLAQIKQGADAEQDVALRVIADHARATAFLVADGVMPSNEARGYVLRRIMRRAIRFGVKIGLDRPFFHNVTDHVLRDFTEAYPELAERASFVGEVVQAEEDRFRRTLDRGMKLLDQQLERVGTGGTLPGEVAFTLSDTYGFPLDLTALIAEERGQSVDEAGFTKALAAQQAAGRAAWKGSGEAAVTAIWRDLAREHGESDFRGYDDLQGESSIVALVQTEEGAPTSSVATLGEGHEGIVVLNSTPFYGESGGQVGDTGFLRSGQAVARVTDTQLSAGLRLHHVVVESGELEVGASLVAEVDALHRDPTRRNHTATHLLHAALRTVLGEHVTQKGSLVGPNRLRFDFSHHKPMTQDELRRVEDLVNEQVLANTEVGVASMSFDAAREAGAMALFGEKYGDEVRVVDVPGFSVELCGGTHVSRTGDIGQLVVQSESGVAAGVRRIEAQTGDGARQWVRGQLAQLRAAATAAKTSPDRLVDTLETILVDRRNVKRERDTLIAQMAAQAAGDLLSNAKQVGDVTVLAARIDGDLRKQADTLRDQLGSAVVILAAERGPKVQLLVAATKDVVDRGVHAGKLIGELAPMVGGRGGGRPDMAQAGGKDSSGIDAALARGVALAEEVLS